tara:strand:- start:1375 stop:2217 length:843 start_codon:yes stop_codon:yes gene_type:complete
MAEILNRILSGNLSSNAGGFLLRMPDGFIGRRLLNDAVESAYGVAHPNLRILDPDSRTISVDDIRGLRDFLATSAMGEGMKTLLVVAAERMNVQAANAFLKSLEEPSRKTRIILATDTPWTLPATVLSRCHKLNLTANLDELAAEVQSFFEEEKPSDLVSQALELTSHNPTAAADVIRHNLLEWHAAVREWLGNPKDVTPSAPGTGKEAPSIATLFRLLQNDILKTSRGQVGIPGWTEERAEQASIILNSMSRGLTRPGLDWKNRLFSTLNCLAHMETAK